MNRREFSLAAAAATAAAALAPRAVRAQEPAVAPRATKLYHDALILDCNAAPPWEGNLPLPQAELDLVPSSGINVVKLSLGGINDNFEQAVADIALAQRIFELHPAYFTQVRVADDMMRAKREGKLGVILSFESVDMLQGKVESIELFRNLGVRVMQLSYNRKSPFAAGVMEPDGGGLTALGRQAVGEMNRLGIAVDLSHANAQTTTDALALSSKPPVMTHAGCAAVHAHPRNKTDEQLRALAARGGVVGIFDLPYLTASPRQPRVEDYMEHMEHALKVVGEEHVGVGSDVGVMPFDTSAKGMAEFAKSEEERQRSGLAAPEEDRPTYVEGMNTPRRIEIICDQLLKRGYPPTVAEKVIGANFARVFADIWNV